MKRFFSIVIYLSFIFFCFAENTKNSRILYFKSLSGKEQIDSVVEKYLHDCNFTRNLEYNNCVEIINNNIRNTKEYLISRLKESKPTLTGNPPGEFEILSNIEGNVYLYSIANGWDKTEYFPSIEEYIKELLPIYKNAIDFYISEYKTLDKYVLNLMTYISGWEGQKRIYALEDLPKLLEDLTVKGYSGLTINTEGIYPRSLYEKYGWSF